MSTLTVLSMSAIGHQTIATSKNGSAFSDTAFIWHYNKSAITRVAMRIFKTLLFF